MKSTTNETSSTSSLEGQSLIGAALKRISDLENGDSLPEGARKLARAKLIDRLRSLLWHQCKALGIPVPNKKSNRS